MGQALYRKYRTKTFAETVGQEHVTTTLQNAIAQGKISHAYLFTGPRGTGKTSIARILAHEINGLSYNDETHLDIIEIDAASNRRIDEIRDLRDRVNTAPSVAKYKVYIIDEVHMLTKEAFNALLKTLEEPPAHVVFMLATTESHKLPETIISRTQRYTLRLVPAEQVIAHLRFIAQSEKIAIDDDALALIAEHGEGTFRDSISLLDQASSTSDHVTLADIERVLGLAPLQQITELNNAVRAHNSSDIVTVLNTLYSSGYEPAAIAMQLSAILRQEVLNGSEAAHQLLALLQELLDVAGARNPRQLLELVLLRASLGNAPATVVAPIASVVPTPVAAVVSTPPAPSKSAMAPSRPTSKAAAPEKPKQPEPTPVAPEQPEPTPATTEQSEPTETPMAAIQPQGDVDITELWQQTLDEIKRQYNTLYGIARMAKPELHGNSVTLTFKFAFHQKRINETKNRKIFADVLERLYGAPLEIVCVVADKTESADVPKPDVATISNIFGGAELLES